MATAREKAFEVLEDLADDTLTERADLLEMLGTHEWVFDPQVPGVVGLVRKGTNRADVVVYLEERDFEESDDFWNTPTRSA